MKYRLISILSFDIIVKFKQNKQQFSFTVMLKQNKSQLNFQLNLVDL